MIVHSLLQQQVLPISLADAWEFFSSPRNLNAITPPDLGFQITYCSGDEMHEGQIITYRIALAPFIAVPWVTEIQSVQAPHHFIDVQLSGPYALWHHRHQFAEHPDGVLMDDVVHYALPFGPLGTIAHQLYVKQKLQHIFNYRREMLARHFG